MSAAELEIVRSSWKPTAPKHDGERLARASWAFTTRRVPREAACRVGLEARTPRSGDLVLARVDVLGHHRGLQLACGRKRSLFPGDEIVVAYGNRYASSQFEAVVPRTLGPCQLVAGGGVAAKALSWHSRVAKGPTRITPVGLLLGADDRPLNLAEFALEPGAPVIDARPRTVAVVGTGMDSGKTDSAAHLVRGLARGGFAVGYAKITGTGAGGDTWLLKDAGACPVLDFTDAGLVSTYLTPLAEIERIARSLIAHLLKDGAEAIVLEVADGVLQKETAALLESPVFQSLVGGYLLAARESMGAESGVRWLQARGLQVAGVTGVLTASPLQIREAEEATGLPALTRDALADAHRARSLIAEVERGLQN